MNVSIKSKKFNISFELNHKFSVLTGDSAIGKTTLASMLVSNIPNVEITSTHDIIILTRAIFENAMKRIERFYASQDQKLPIADTDEHRKQRIKMLNDYWKNEDNQLVWDQLVIIDDEDFVSSTEFACMYNNDKTNYYLSINRANISMIDISTEAVYTLRSNERNYWLEPAYAINNDLCQKYDYYLIENRLSELDVF